MADNSLPPSPSSSSCHPSSASLESITPSFSALHEVPPLMRFKCSKPMISYANDLPFVVTRARLDAHLLSAIQSSVMFSHSHEDLVKSADPAKVDIVGSLGYAACIDYPRLPTHKYFEGYFHAHPPPSSADSSLADQGLLSRFLKLFTLDGGVSASTLVIQEDGHVISMHPRLGISFQKPPADPLLRSFASAFRLKNDMVLKRTAVEMKELREEIGVMPKYMDHRWVEVGWGEDVGVGGEGISFKEM